MKPVAIIYLPLEEALGNSEAPDREVQPEPACIDEHGCGRLPSKDDTCLQGMTQRETEVLSLVAQGKSNRQIAQELVVSVRTIERHITNIYRKINSRSRVDAVLLALEHGLMPHPTREVLR
jgi:DNA-binding NarL/FixJ family response regulator